MKPTVLRSSVLLTLLALGCASAPGSRSNADSRPPAGGEASGLVGVVAHTDARVDVPTFLWVSRDPDAGAAFADAESAALGTVRALRTTLRLSDAALAALARPTLHDSGKGAIIARAAQRVRGREVFRGGASVVMTRAFEPVAVSSLLAPSLEGSEAPFALDAEAALRRAYSAATGTDLGDTPASAPRADAEDRTRVFTGPLFSQPVRVKEVFFPLRDALEPAHRVELLLRSGVARSLVISARDGRVLFDNDLVRSQDLEMRVWASPSTLLPMDGPQGNAFTPHVTGRPDRTKPSYVAPELVRLRNFPFSKNDPWLPTGATETRGNNVDAYTDLVAPDGFGATSADVRSNLSAPGPVATFDWTYDTASSPNASPEAFKGSVNHLFYVTNFLHDWFYDAGFDEQSGNPQQDNFGRGGKGGDRLLAESQDYSGRNNANALTPADGASPRIQMYVFAGKTTSTLLVESPAALAGARTVGVAGAFGKDKFVTSAPVVLAQDGAGDAADACEVLTNIAAVRGKIALVHRGSCSFVEKAQRVQAAGGVGVLVANVASSVSPNVAPYMGGQAGDVAIPAFSLSLPDGQALEGALAEGVSVTMRREGSSDLDGALDTGVLSHEWGHVLSSRLIGDADGLRTNQAGGLGEGWGDFTAQLVMVRADDLTSPQGAGWSGVYPTGTYATSGSGDDSYFGIRRQPYSTDMTKNGLTFKHISAGVPLPKDVPTSFGEDGSNNAEVHATGEVWASMLWECYAGLLRDPRYTFPAAQERMKRYLVQSLKATPVDPTLIEARDAVIAVAFASDEGDFQAFWRAFAKRGAGVGATGPAKSSPDNGGAKESFAVGGDLEILSATLADDLLSCDQDGVLDTDESGALELTVRNSGAAPLDGITAKISTGNADLVLADGGELKLPALKPFAVGRARLKVSARGSHPLEAIALDIAVTAPGLANPRTLQRRVEAQRDADELEGSSARDDVQTNGTAWQVTSRDRTGTSVAWRRVRDGLNQYWSVPNAGEPSDHKLASPLFNVAGAGFGLKLRHRWDFESSAERRLDFDGGVIEVSLDGGKSWKDASTYGAVGYNVTLDNDPQGTNPLKGRKAFGRKSEGYPAWREEILELRLPAPSAQVSVRFRAGADDNTAEAGWDLDDIELTGIEDKPFWSLVPHREACSEDGPKASAGAPLRVAPKATVKLEGSATHPKGLPLGFAWTQVDGPPVTLASADTATPSFTAPATDTKLAFSLRANDGARLSAPSRVEVTVLAVPEPPTPVYTLSGGCATAPAGEPGGSPFGLGALAGVAVALVRGRRRARG